MCAFYNKPPNVSTVPNLVLVFLQSYYELNES